MIGFPPSRRSLAHAVLSLTPLVLCEVFCEPFVIASRAETAEEWLRRSQAARFPGQDMRARFVMRIDRADGTRLRRTGVSLRRTRSDGLADRLFVVRSPTSLAGLALLSLDQPAKPASQWLYLPTYRRARPRRTPRYR